MPETALQTVYQAALMTNCFSLCYIILNIHYTKCYQIVDMTLPTLCDLGDMISR